MGSTAAVTDYHNNPNYVGKIFQVSAEMGHAFLADIAGGDFVYSQGIVMPRNFLQIGQFDFAMASPWSLDAGSQPDIDETDARTAPTGTTYARGQDLNTNQIFQETVDVSYKNMSTTNQLKQAALADPITALAAQGQPNEAMNAVLFQIEAHVAQVSTDANYTFLNGTFATSTDNTTSAQTRGLIAGISTCAVAAGSANLTKAHINSVVKKMKEAGAPCRDLCIYTAAFHVQEIDELYGLQERSNLVGGTSINEIYIPLLGSKVAVKFDYHVSAGTVLIADRAFINPVGCPVPEKGFLFYENLAKAGAVEYGHVYGQMGVDYGPEEYHGKITGLATS